MRIIAPLLLVGLLVGLMAGCTSGSPESSPTPSATTSTAPTPAATPAPRVSRPRVDACHRLGYAAALAPTDAGRPVPCRGPHTTQTFRVGDLEELGGLADGHLLAVDAERVQQRLSATCPGRLAAYAGGSLEDLRTSMLRAIWFSPSVEAFTAGQDWYRCDVTVLAGSERLLRLRGGLAGALEADGWRDRYGMCGTADPASDRFRRVVCSAPHSWQAIATVPADGGATDACEAPAREVATDPLTVTWSYEPPTRQQRRAGQGYGLCWVPVPGTG